MHSEAQLFLDQLQAGLSAGMDLSRMSRWLEINTRHPENKFERWSFKDHEFQIDIVNDTKPEQVCIKCAQIGVSEIYSRLALGLVSILRQSTGIYTLPTSTFATRFSKQRLDTVVENSPVLKELIDPETNNSSLKRFGDSFLYISGTFTKGSAISVPAHFLIHDEVDFSDPVTLASFDSRLGHRKEDAYIRRWFSTPTVPGYGVDKLYLHSDRKTRAVLCDHCNTWQTPKFSEHAVLPGFDRSLVEFSAEDLHDPKVRVEEAHIACPGCRRPITVSNFADPNKREWVPELPGAARSGFHCQPFDVPQINTIPRVFRAADSYQTGIADWWNFKVGKPFEDSSSSFVEEAVSDSFRLQSISPGPGAANGCVIGIDTGKTCWITVARPNSVSTTYIDMDALHVERLRIEKASDLLDRVKDLAKWFGASTVVVDAMPEWSQALALKEGLNLPVRSFANYYVKSVKSAMANIDLNEEEQIVKVARSDMIGMIAKSMNNGKIAYPAMLKERKTVHDHLRSLKRIKLPSRTGDMIHQWINTGPDHFAHSLIYAGVAAIIARDSIGNQVTGGLPLASAVKISGPTTGDFYTGKTRGSIYGR